MHEAAKDNRLEVLHASTLRNHDNRVTFLWAVMENYAIDAGFYTNARNSGTQEAHHVRTHPQR